MSSRRHAFALVAFCGIFAIVLFTTPSTSIRDVIAGDSPRDNASFDARLSAIERTLKELVKEVQVLRFCVMHPEKVKEAYRPMSSETEKVLTEAKDGVIRQLEKAQKEYVRLLRQESTKEGTIKSAKGDIERFQKMLDAIVAQLPSPQTN